MAMLQRPFAIRCCARTMGSSSWTVWDCGLTTRILFQNGTNSLQQSCPVFRLQTCLARITSLSVPYSIWYVGGVLAGRWRCVCDALVARWWCVGDACGWVMGWWTTATVAYCRSAGHLRKLHHWTKQKLHSTGLFGSPPHKAAIRLQALRYPALFLQ